MQFNTGNRYLRYLINWYRSKWITQICCECETSREVESVITGQKNNVSCWGCHKSMSFMIPKLKVVKGDSGISKGELKDRGVCKHDKFIFKWFRYPCCGKMYPCDKCHKDHEKHKIQTITNMICGFCSEEQKD